MGAIAYLAVCAPPHVCLPLTSGDVSGHQQLTLGLGTSGQPTRRKPRCGRPFRSWAAKVVRLWAYVNGGDSCSGSFVPAGRPHPAGPAAGAHPAPQWLPGLTQWTRTSDQTPMVLDTQPLPRGPGPQAALQGANR